MNICWNLVIEKTNLRNIKIYNAVDDRTEPNLPNTEASVRYYSVRFGSVGLKNTEPNQNHSEKVP